MHTFWYVHMPNVTAGYGMFSDSLFLFGIFIDTTCLKFNNFIELLQIVC